MKKGFGIMILATLFALCLTSCTSSSTTEQSDTSSTQSIEESSDSSTQSSEQSSASTASTGSTAALEDGQYTVDFKTDSSMFHVNEANEGHGVLTVKDGEMTVHVSLVSKRIVNVYVGTKEQAQKDSKNILDPTTDTVTYSDGYTEEVYGFDIPVPALDEDFNVAIIGEKGKWYDHVVSVSNPEPID